MSGKIPLVRVHIGTVAAQIAFLAIVKKFTKHTTQQFCFSFICMGFEVRERWGPHRLTSLWRYCTYAYAREKQISLYTSSME